MKIQHIKLKWFNVIHQVNDSTNKTNQNEIIIQWNQHFSWALAVTWEDHDTGQRFNMLFKYIYKHMRKTNWWSVLFFSLN